MDLLDLKIGARKPGSRLNTITECSFTCQSSCYLSKLFSCVSPDMCKLHNHKKFSSLQHGSNSLVVKTLHKCVLQKHKHEGQTRRCPQRQPKRRWSCRVVSSILTRCCIDLFTTTKPIQYGQSWPHRQLFFNPQPNKPSDQRKALFFTFQRFPFSDPPVTGLFKERSSQLFLVFN